MHDCSFTGLLCSDISDHLPIFCINHKKFTNTNEGKYIVFRDKSRGNVTKFRECLSKVHWHDLVGISNPNDAYGNFMHKYYEIFNNSFPLKNVKKESLLLKNLGYPMV